MMKTRPAAIASTVSAGLYVCPAARVGGGGEHALGAAEGGGVAQRGLLDHEERPAARAPAESGSSSLGSLTVNGHDIQRGHPCKPDGLWGARISGGPKFPMACKRLACQRCLPRLVATRQLVLAESRPRRFMTITLVAPEDAKDPWAIARVRIKRMIEAYRELTGSVIEYSVVIEHNPRGTGYHAHFLCHGDFIKQSKMREAAVRAGAGTRKPDIREIKWGAGQAIAGYGLKGFRTAGYSVKSFHGETAARALEINGGRLEHHSRGFIKVGGEPSLMRQAEENATLLRYGQRNNEPLMLFTTKGMPFRVIDDGTAYQPEVWARGKVGTNEFGYHPAFGRYIEGASFAPIDDAARAALLE